MRGETIVAVATPRGAGGIGIVRVSGPLADGITAAVTAAADPPARHAALRRFHDDDGAVLDTGLVVRFPGPASFTGEDVVEWQLHGAPVVLDRLVARAVALGARLARPGEFTERAYLNGRIDLAQAEAVADLIAASHLGAARGAARSLEGAFSDQVGALAAELVALRVSVEATIDFPDEDVEFLAGDSVRQRLLALVSTLEALGRDAHQGVLLGQGWRVVLFGAPNVGKSSLMNALVGREAAIVTEHAGTTRDVLRELIHVQGMPVTITDTAGLRETSEPVERIGTDRARAAVADADLAVHVTDDTDGAPVAEATLSGLGGARPGLIVRNKCDLTGTPAGKQPAEDGVPCVAVSARTGAGLDVFLAAIAEAAGFSPPEDVFVARRRHVEALSRTANALRDAVALLDVQGDIDTVLVAEECRVAHEHLMGITGHFGSEDLLGEIFSNFCIGK